MDDVWNRERWERLDPTEVVFSDDILYDSTASVNVPIINTVIELEGDVTVEWTIKNVAAKLTRHPRFCSVIDTGKRRPRFAYDPDFDVRNHVKREEVELNYDELSSILSQPLPFDRPFWHIHIFKPSGVEHHSKILFRVHHIIGDGVSLGRYFVNLVADHAVVDAAVERPLNPRQGLHGDLLKWGARATRWDALTRPIRDIFAAAADPLKRDPPNSLINADLSVRPGKRAWWARRRSVRTLRAASRAVGVTINDFLLAAYTGALRAHFLNKDDEVIPRRLTASIPVNRHDPTSEVLSNAFTVLLFRLPIHQETPQARLAACVRHMSDMKAGFRAPLMRKIADLLTVIPAAVRRSIWKRATQCATIGFTNVQGPPEALTCDKRAIRDIRVLGDGQGRFGIILTAFSYNDTLSIGLLSTPERMPNPQAFLELFDAELDALLDWST